MKKAITLILVFTLISGMFILSGCSNDSSTNLEMVSSYMLDDDTAYVEFRNETGKTISHVVGQLNLFSGSSNNQTPLKVVHFEWSGSCENGALFEARVEISNAPSGLANEVNRIGFSISTIS